MNFLPFALADSAFDGTYLDAARPPSLRAALPARRNQRHRRKAARRAHAAGNKTAFSK